MDEYIAIFSADGKVVGYALLGPDFMATCELFPSFQFQIIKRDTIEIPLSQFARLSISFFEKNPSYHQSLLYLENKEKKKKETAAATVNLGEVFSKLILEAVKKTPNDTQGAK